MKAWTRAVYAVGVLVVVTGCGGGGGSFADKSVDDIVKAASHDMGDVRSLGVSGDLTTGGTTYGIDVHIIADGGCTGTLKVGDGSSQIVSKDSTYWMKPDHAFWESQDPSEAAVIEKAVGDKWITIPSSSDLDAFCDLDTFLKNFTGASNGPTKGSVVGTEKVGGKQAVKITGTDHGDPVVAWVATGEPHYVLKIRIGGSADTTGSLTFTDFDKPVRLRTPAPTDVANLGG